MIFGRSGSGKTTFASDLHKITKLPLYHLDKYFFESNWIEKDYNEFMSIQHNIVNKEQWIIDGNSVKSLETRWSKANLVIYFNYSKYVCLYRLFKRLFQNRSHFDDRAQNCKEKLRFKFIMYMWNFEKRVSKQIVDLQFKYPKVQYLEITSKAELTKYFGIFNEIL